MRGQKNQGVLSQMELVKSNGPQSAIETLRPHARCSGNGLRQHARCLLRLMCRESQRPHGDEADGDEENGYRVLGEQAPRYGYGSCPMRSCSICRSALVSAVAPCVTPSASAVCAPALPCPSARAAASPLLVGGEGRSCPDSRAAAGPAYAAHLSEAQPAHNPCPQPSRRETFASDLASNSAWFRRPNYAALIPDPLDFVPFIGTNPRNLFPLQSSQNQLHNLTVLRTRALKLIKRNLVGELDEPKKKLPRHCIGPPRAHRPRCRDEAVDARSSGGVGRSGHVSLPPAPSPSPAQAPLALRAPEAQRQGESRISCASCARPA